MGHLGSALPPGSLSIDNTTVVSPNTSGIVPLWRGGEICMVTALTSRSHTCMVHNPYLLGRDQYPYKYTTPTPHPTILNLPIGHRGGVGMYPTRPPSRTYFLPNLLMTDAQFDAQIRIRDLYPYSIPIQYRDIDIHSFINMVISNIITTIPMGVFLSPQYAPHLSYYP